MRSRGNLLEELLFYTRLQVQPGYNTLRDMKCTGKQHVKGSLNSTQRPRRVCRRSSTLVREAIRLASTHLEQQRYIVQGYNMYRDVTCTGIHHVQGCNMYRDTTCLLYRDITCTGMQHVQGYIMYRDTTCTLYRDITCTGIQHV